jgi:hypothetical protein
MTTSKEILFETSNFMEPNFQEADSYTTVYGIVQHFMELAVHCLAYKSLSLIH